MLPRGCRLSGRLAATQPFREGHGVGEVDEEQVGTPHGLLEESGVERAAGLGAAADRLRPEDAEGDPATPTPPTAPRRRPAHRARAGAAHGAGCRRRRDATLGIPSQRDPEGLQVRFAKPRGRPAAPPFALGPRPAPAPGRSTPRTPRPPASTSAPPPRQRQGRREQLPGCVHRRRAPTPRRSPSARGSASRSPRRAAGAAAARRARPGPRKAGSRGSQGGSRGCERQIVRDRADGCRSG